MEYIAKQIDFAWFDQSSFARTTGEKGIPADLSMTFDVVREIKAKNPTTKVGVYGQGGGGICTFHLPYASLDYSPSYSDFLHFYADGNVIPQDPADPSNPNSVSPRCFYLNMGNEQTLQKIVNFWKDTSNQKGIDGIFIDSYSPHYYAQQMLNAGGCKEVNCSSEKGYWLQYMTKFSNEIKKNVKVGVDLVYNGISYKGSEDGLANITFIDYHTGAISEHTHEIYNNPTAFYSIIDTAQKVLKSGKKYFFWVSPQIDPSLKNELEMERFFLASYLLIQQSPLSYFGYHSGKPFDGSTLYFYKDWNLDFGNPLKDFESDASKGLYWREYQNGLVIVNPTEIPAEYDLKGNFKLWSTDGEVVNGKTVIPGNTGRFFINYQSSPSPVAKVGDLDKDGDVDIFDLRLFLMDLTNNNLRSDFNQSGRVDILDFNLLLKYYGK